jgi:hypothetical protein
MYKSVFALALCVTTAGCVTPQSTEGQVATARSSSTSAQSDGRVCETVQEEDTGTRLGGRKVCRPASKDETGTSPS